MIIKKLKINYDNVYQKLKKYEIEEKIIKKEEDIYEEKIYKIEVNYEEIYEKLSCIKPKRKSNT